MTNYSTISAHAADHAWERDSNRVPRYILAQASTSASKASLDAIVDRMDEIERNDTYDLDADDLRRSRQWRVGDEEN